MSFKGYRPIQTQTLTTEHEKKACRVSIIAAVLSFAIWMRVLAQDVNNGDFKIDPGLALTSPDAFNWTLLAAISKKAPDNLQFKVGTNTTNNAVFETWADDPFTFPSAPDPAHPPKWEDRNRTTGGRQGFSVEAITQQQLRARMFAHPAPSLLPQAIIQNGGGEVVFRNQSSFDFIIKNGLFYKEGLAAMFKAAVNGKGFASRSALAFDPSVIELKAIYMPLNQTLTKNNCHWNYDASGNAVGLVALHLMSKQLPNWTWATWEWSGDEDQPQPTGNPGRSDWYGSRDTFGVVYKDTPHFQAPVTDQNGNPSGMPYPSGAVSDALKKVFRMAGFSEEWRKEWSNYRLKGSQIDFTDTSGGAVLVGNSVTESGFVQTSSCITCHGSASVDETGAPDPSVGFTVDGQSRNGPLDAGWFYDLNVFDAAQQFGRYKVNYYPVDFVWAFRKAHAMKP